MKNYYYPKPLKFLPQNSIASWFIKLINNLIYKIDSFSGFFFKFVAPPSIICNLIILVKCKNLDSSRLFVKMYFGGKDTVHLFLPKTWEFRWHCV